MDGMVESKRHVWGSPRLHGQRGLQLLELRILVVLHCMPVCVRQPTCTPKEQSGTVTHCLRFCSALLDGARARGRP